MNVCLCMIVKNDADNNEAHCILRCLDSCEDFITHAAILLTHEKHASSELDLLIDKWGMDSNVDIEMRNYEWHDDFAAARNQALAMVNWAWPKTDWLLLIDADEELRLGPGGCDMLKNILGEIKQDSVVIPLIHEGRIVTRVNLIRNIPGWQYKFRHHETIELNGKPPEPAFIGSVTHPTSGPHVFTAHDGARSKNPDKITREVELLQQDYDDTQEPRYLFFLGMTLLNMKDEKRALEVFSKYCAEERRPENDGLKYAALLRMGRLSGNLDMFACAHELCPTRNEALGELAIDWCKKGIWHVAYLYALAANQPVRPTHLEFIEPMWSAWRALDILTVCLINMDRYGEALNYLQALMARDTLPESEILRVQSHLNKLEEICGIQRSESRCQRQTNTDHA